MANLLSKPLEPDNEELVVQQLAALAQSTRLNLFRELIKTCDCSDGGGLAAGELARRMQLAPPTLSFHIKELTRSGLVQSRKEGRSIIYSVDGTAIRSLIDFMLEDCCTESNPSQAK